MDAKENKMLTGTIWKQILIFFFPILIGTFFQQLYNTIDALIVGRYSGKIALSAVGGSSAQIINFVVGFFTGLTGGASIMAVRTKRNLRMLFTQHMAFQLLVDLF